MILVVNWFGIQSSRRFPFLRNFLQNWSFETPKQNFFARLPSKLKLWSCKTNLFYETSFKIQNWKLKKRSFCARLHLKWSFEAQKRSFCARLPSKMKHWSSKTKLLCETSFKNEALKLKSEAFVRDVLQKCYADQTLDLRIPIHFSDFWIDASKVALPREKHRFRPSSNPPRLPTFLQPSRTPVPATYFATYRNPCACHTKSILNLQKRLETVNF